MEDFVKMVSLLFLQKEAKNQDEKCNNPLGIFVRGSYGKRDMQNKCKNPGSDCSGEF